MVIHSDLNREFLHYVYVAYPYKLTPWAQIYLAIVVWLNTTTLGKLIKVLKTYASVIQLRSNVVNFFIMVKIKANTSAFCKNNLLR